MKLSAVHLVWLLFFAALVLGAAGCASEPDNDSVRPWGAPANGGAALPIQNEQHPE